VVENSFPGHEFFRLLRHEIKKQLSLFSLMLASLVMGEFFGNTWFTLTRSIHELSSAEFIHIGETIIANVAIPMSIIIAA
jgi:hypothetical protein